MPKARNYVIREKLFYQEGKGKKNRCVTRLRGISRLRSKNHGKYFYKSNDGIFNGVGVFCDH